MLNWNNIQDFLAKGNLPPSNKVIKSDQEWREIMSTEAYAIMREKGTERPFSSEMCAMFEEGLYACSACDNLLFDASVKFDSGTGWPSFTSPIHDNAIAYVKDTSYGRERVEAICNVCDSHLGHVFPDGPAPSGLRYCMNALALKKKASL